MNLNGQNPPNYLMKKISKKSLLIKERKLENAGFPIITIYGHKLYEKGKNVYYLDDDSLFTGDRPCPFCHKYSINGMDACLGKLPGVRYADCGHGLEQGYILFNNGKRVTLAKIDESYMRSNWKKQEILDAEIV